MLPFLVNKCTWNSSATCSWKEPSGTRVQEVSEGCRGGTGEAKYQARRAVVAIARLDWTQLAWQQHLAARRRRTRLVSPCSGRAGPEMAAARCVCTAASALTWSGLRVNVLLLATRAGYFGGSGSSVKFPPKTATSSSGPSHADEVKSKHLRRVSDKYLQMTARPLPGDCRAPSVSVPQQLNVFITRESLPRHPRSSRSGCSASPRRQGACCQPWWPQQSWFQIQRGRKLFQAMWASEKCPKFTSVWQYNTLTRPIAFVWNCSNCL